MPNNYKQRGGTASQYCAPGRPFQNQSCLSLNALRKIAKAYNQTYPGRQINMTGAGHSKEHLWNQVKNRLDNICQDQESCWIEQDFVIQLQDPEIKNTFKPKRPLGRYQWLSTSDIHDVMNQYEQEHPDFSFLGPVPLNFSTLSDQLVDEVNNLDLAKVSRRGISKIGIVFNMSPWIPNGQVSGSHWVALWIDISKQIMAFFDSYGYDPKASAHRGQVHCIPDQIQKLINKLIRNHPNFQVKCNKIRHQRANSECGVYCMYFITQCLEGRRPEAVFKDIKLDEEMNQQRDFFFRP